MTGGSLGIGKVTAKLLVEKGCKVVITGRDNDRLQSAANFSAAIPLSFDISNLDAIAENAKKCISLLDGRVDGLINNAGIGSFELIENVDKEQFLQCLTPMFLACLCCLKK